MAPTQKNLIGKGMPTQACVDDEGCSGSGAPVSSPSVEKETETKRLVRRRETALPESCSRDDGRSSTCRRSRECSHERTQIRASVKERHCAGSLQREITTESPLLPWLVRQCDVAGEVGQKRTAPDLVLRSDEPGSSKLRRKGKSVPISPNPADKATHELTYTSFRNWCGFCVRARAADDPHHRQPHKES